MLLPEGLYKNYDRFIQKYRKILFLIIIITLILYIAFLFWKFNKDFQEGPDLSSLREKISLRLLDSCATGLNRYNKINGQYPQNTGKYFFNSIKLLVYIDDVYIYTNDKNLTDLVSSGFNKDSLLLGNNLFIGIGSSEQYITYKYLTNEKYLLYSVGENGIDENGEGDDLPYQ